MSGPDLPAALVPAVTSAETAIEVLTAATEAVSATARTFSPGGEGLCLPYTAALGWWARTRCAIDATAVAGVYGRHAHWWLEAGGVRYDPTVTQFGPELPLVTPADSPGPYRAEQTFPAGWEQHHLAPEAARVFVYTEAAEEWAQAVIAALDSLSPAR